MIDPSATAILRTIDAALVERVAPSLGDVTGRSALATIRHLLRLVRVRIEEEGQVLTEDVAALHVLLGRVAGYFDTPGAAAAAEAGHINSALAADRPDPDRYPDLVTLGARAGALRAALHRALVHLVAIAPEHVLDHEYTSIRTAIRDYMAWQIGQEARLIAPAFHGHGPRR